MTKIPYTEKHIEQYRGPNDSAVYNKNSDDVYQDLVYLYNKANEIEAEANNAYSATAKDIKGLIKEVEDLRAELAVATSTYQPGVFLYSGSEDEDVDRFDSTAYEIIDSERLEYDGRFDKYTLPRNTTSSISKIKFLNAQGNVAIPPSLRMVVNPDQTSIDNSTSSVKTSQPYDAVLAEPGRVWERNVASEFGNDEAVLDLFFNLPEDLTSTEFTNTINFVPFPVFEVDVLGVYYTTQPYPDLSLTGSIWTALNDTAIYYNDTAAIGYIPPGGWAGDEILDSPPLSFTFPNKKITAIRITLRRQNPYNLTTEFAYPKHVYTYGLSYLDVRYDKTSDQGKSIFKITPQAGDTISSIDQITPYIYSVGQQALADVFSYRVIWETSPDSGTYTLTPVPLSTKVWLEVTLQKDAAGNIPALNGFKVEYS